jgi:predicted transcriptional regulator
MPYFDDLKTLRVGAGIRKSILAREAKVDRTTLDRVEKHDAARLETLIAIINALNSLHYNNNAHQLDPDVLISDKSKFR